MAIVYLSLGSNKGDRIGYVQQAASLLGADEGISIVRTSAFYESEPWNMNTKNWFVNAVVEAKTKYSPQELLEVCQRIEKQLGRTSEEKNQYQDRTIDIDILFYNKDIINEENLIIPHKYVHLRAFTLVPMMELNSDFVHPVLHKNIVEMHNDLENPEMVFLYGTRVDF
ncbi:MAG: 2-amino-4-hydroxy-6-hydroxymethyldihydropteridine diphosphokinase [Candidatus Melainabacteria bacterium]|jgi:2-amino-4-hydroxy-6-hydroxymethyldihydropteridine diphosphokinase|nr:MAG: 2-amino-4-hydroxy-6-hydroxymethyldihydropteridine diphosphokinase [Candidatus Melainabacteria bacterium]